MGNMYLTSGEIFGIIWDWIRNSPLAEAVPTMYADHYPPNVEGEFIVVNTLSNALGGKQIATVNVNIYVPDQTPSFSSAQAQRYSDRKRLAELTRIAYDSLSGYPGDERWIFDVSDESLISEEEVSYTFSNIKVKFKQF